MKDGVATWSTDSTPRDYRPEREKPPEDWLKTCVPPPLVSSSSDQGEEPPYEDSSTDEELGASRWISRKIARLIAETGPTDYEPGEVIPLHEVENARQLENMRMRNARLSQAHLEQLEERERLERLRRAIHQPSRSSRSSRGTTEPTPKIASRRKEKD